MVLMLVLMLIRRVFGFRPGVVSGRRRLVLCRFTCKEAVENRFFKKFPGAAYFTNYRSCYILGMRIPGTCERVCVCVLVGGGGGCA